VAISYVIVLLVLAPLSFLILATLTAFVMAYGTHPYLATLSGGMDIICVIRRLQWPLMAASIVFCLAVVALVVAGRRRAWWLLGLGPVLALFLHAFTAGPTAGWTIVEDPVFVEASEALSIADDHYVVGIINGDEAFAYPYSALFSSPLILQPDRERRLMLIWNAYANKATAMFVDRAIKARELDLVTTAGNGLLIYNSRHGQFINGVTGQTNKGEKPIGTRAMVQTYKMPWRHWRTLRPATKVMLPVNTTGPTSPLVPAFPMPESIASEPTATVTVVAATQPAAVVEKALRGPANFSTGDTAVLLLPDNLTGMPRAFDRRVKEDLFPSFNTIVADEKRGTMLIDADSQSLWTLDGRATTGWLKGERLKPIPTETGLDYRIMKFWLPELILITPDLTPTIELPQKEVPAETTRPRRKRS
jgi:hypothetical protein